MPRSVYRLWDLPLASSFAFVAELPAFGTSEPLTGYGVGITPKLQYTFGSGLISKVAGDTIWTNLGGHAQSLINNSEPTRLDVIAYSVFWV
jgi:hypothetical protein